MMMPCLGSSRVWLILAHRCLLSHMHNWVLLADCCFSQQVCEGRSPWGPWLPLPPLPIPACVKARGLLLSSGSAAVSHSCYQLTQVGRNKLTLMAA